MVTKFVLSNSINRAHKPNVQREHIWLQHTIELGVSRFVVFLFAVICAFDYVFSENGLVAHKMGKLISEEVCCNKNKASRLSFQPTCVYSSRGSCSSSERTHTCQYSHMRLSVAFCQSIVSKIGEEKLQRFINFTMKCLSEITLPAKRYRKWTAFDLC